MTNTDEQDVLRFENSLRLPEFNDVLCHNVIQETKDNLLNDYKRREQEKLRDKLDHKLKALEPFLCIARQALASALLPFVPSPCLNDDDIRLAITWSERPDLKELCEDYSLHININTLIERFGEDYHLGRMLSARAAEKVARAFYKVHGKSVIDVSIEQVRQPSNDDWRQCDLRVDGNPIDVKNARRSKSSPKNRYVEHCVPKFKRDRHNNDVTVAGVLSSYLKPSEFLRSNVFRLRYGDALFLGELTHFQLTGLIAEFEEPDLLELNFENRDPAKGKFLPPWLFDYPGYIYKVRDEARDNLSSYLTDLRSSQELGINSIPILIAGNIRIGTDYELNLKAWEVSLVDELQHHIQRCGLSLPIIFLSILKHFLQVISGRIMPSSEYSPSSYKKFSSLKMYHRGH